MFEPRRSVADRYTFSPSPHLPIMKISEHIGKSKKVLDVGCSTGYLAKQLKQKGCSVVGIEIDEAAAEAAKQHCENVLVGDVEQMVKLPYPNGYFNTIVYSDVLEHLKRPDLVLVNLISYIAPDGQALASIPNIARLENRAKLLFGKFDYEDKGHLDKTHLRFFTLRTAKQLFESCGYVIEEVDYTGIASQFRILRLLATLFACQFIIVAVPRNRTD